MKDTIWQYIRRYKYIWTKVTAKNVQIGSENFSNREVWIRRQISYPIGVMMATKENNQIYISWSLCNNQRYLNGKIVELDDSNYKFAKKDIFSKKRARKIASDRMNVIIESGRIPLIPNKIIIDIDHWRMKAARYFNVEECAVYV